MFLLPYIIIYTVYTPIQLKQNNTNFTQKQFQISAGLFKISSKNTEKYILQFPQMFCFLS